MTKEPVVADTTAVEFGSEPSSLLDDAIKAFELAKDELDHEENRREEMAWSVLANQVVGHENL